MIDREAFAKAFTEHTHFRANKYHPLVWINGDPQIGENVYIGGMSEINANGARVVIGDNCDISSFVAINCADSHRLCLGLSDSVGRKDIVLEENVFVGSHSVIKGGAYIGHHSVIAAGTIVEGRIIPPFSLVIGNPMTVKEGYYASALCAPEFVPHNKPSLGIEEEQAAIETVRSGFLAQGKQVSALEDEFCEFLGIDRGHAVAVSSGTAALYLALRLNGAEGKKVAFPAYVCSALMNACHFAGARPHLVDNATGTPNVDLAALRGSGAEVAIVPHTYGIPLNLSGLTGMTVIEDCAHALGARVRGSAVGLQGGAAVFSFYATKLMTSGGQGGMFVAKDKAMAEAARDFREFDQRNDQRPRFNFQMTDLQAAIGREQLKKLPGFLARRQETFSAYQAAGLHLLDTLDPDLEPVRYRAVLRTPDPGRVIAELERIGVRAIVPLEEWELLGNPVLFPNALEVCRNSVSLPIYPTLDGRARDAIVSKLRSL